MNSVASLLARIFIFPLFLNSTLSKLQDMGGLMTNLAEKGVPLPEVTAWVVAITELVFPILILIGYKTRISAMAMLLWLLPVTIIMHPLSDAKQRGSFYKNMAIMSGLIMLAGYGGGKWSLDRSA